MKNDKAFSFRANKGFPDGKIALAGRFKRLSSGPRPKRAPKKGLIKAVHEN
jgi:hypothetical protein